VRRPMLGNHARLRSFPWLPARERFFQATNEASEYPIERLQGHTGVCLSVVRIDFERQIERSARSNDPKILIEHNERFSNRVDDRVRKYPGILDLGELLSEHVFEHG